MSRSTIEHTLEECEFCKGMEKEQLEKIADFCSLKTYDAGNYVFQQGHPGNHMFIIVEGRVVLERSLDLGNRKGSVLISDLGKGKVLGCWSTLLGESHVLMCSATCRTPAKIVTMKGTAIREMMEGDRRTGFFILERLCFLLRDRIQSAYGALEKI